MKYKLAIISFAALPYSSFALTNTDNFNLAKAILPAAPYSSIVEMPLGGSSCIKTPQVIYGDLKNEINFTRTTDNRALEGLLNAKVSGKLGFSKFSGSAEAEFVKSAENTQYSVNANFSEVYSAHLVVSEPDDYGDKILSNKGLNAYKAGTTNFLQTCGDSYVSEMEAGAMLLINANIEFENLAEKSKFEASASAKFGSLADLSGNIDKATKSSGTSGKLTIHAMQLGGDPSRLANIFSKSKDGYYLLECDTENMQACAKGIAGIIEYAQNDFSKQIQIDPSKKSINANQLVYWAPIYNKYSNLGINSPTINLSKEELNNLSILDNWYREDLTNLTFINHVIAAHGKLHFMPSTLESLNHSKNNLQARMNNYLQSGLMACFNPVTDAECQEIFATVKSERDASKPDENLIKHFRNDVYKCLDATDAYLVPQDIEGHYTWFMKLLPPDDSTYSTKVTQTGLLLDGFYRYGTQKYKEKTNCQSDDKVKYSCERNIQDLNSGQNYRYNMHLLKTSLF